MAVIICLVSKVEIRAIKYVRSTLKLAKSVSQKT